MKTYKCFQLKLLLPFSCSRTPRVIISAKDEGKSISCLLATAFFKARNTATKL